MDLSTFADLGDRHDGGAEIRIRDPRDGSETDMVFKVAGPLGAVAYEAKRKAAVAMADVKPDDFDVGEYSRLFLAHRIMDWSGIEWKGKPLAYSPEKAVEIITDKRYSWVVDQINAHFARGDAFLAE